MTRIPLAGVIGHPIHHSRSPALHGHWLKTYGIRGHYIPMDVAEGDLEAVLRTLPKAGFVGCNITIPHKETALALADVVSDRAARIGAANTLVFDETGRIHADNTDGIGFLANLIEGAPGWQAKAGPAAVIGAGGAARGCVTVDGLGMLLHQAVPGFERWFGRRPEVTPELRAVVLAA